MKLVFIASPFRAPTEWGRAENIRHAERFALQVWQLRAVAVCPQANSALFHDELEDYVFLEGYRALLRRCDAVLVCGQESAGVKAELETAATYRIPVFRSVEELSVWLKPFGDCA
jgi:tRNA G18 (ribose-2'-O)-methylase SpoU